MARDYVLEGGASHLASVGVEEIGESLLSDDEGGDGRELARGTHRNRVERKGWLSRHGLYDD